MKKEKIADLLGSKDPVPLKTRNLDGPLTYLNLIREVNIRIGVRIGRPTDVRETKYHNIPLTDETWRKLQEKARVIPSKKTLSASHLAAFLIEQGLKKLERELKEYDLEEQSVQ